MHRFFLSKGDIVDDMAEITGDDARHIAVVLRLRPNDSITLCDGEGMEYTARVKTADSRRVCAQIYERRACATEPACRATLYQALPKADKLDVIVQKSVELGVCAITPVMTARCVARPDGFAKKRDRLSRIAAEAAKQARRGMIPEVNPLTPLIDCDFSRHDAVLLAYEEERTLTFKQAIREAAARGGRDAAIIVGPEGGFAPEEAALMMERGARPVTLGPRVLRTETAGMAMLAMLFYEWEL